MLENITPQNDQLALELSEYFNNISNDFSPLEKSDIPVVYFFRVFPYAFGNRGLRRHSPVGIILHLIFTEETVPYANSNRS